MEHRIKKKLNVQHLETGKYTAWLKAPFDRQNNCLLKGGFFIVIQNLFDKRHISCDI